MAFGINFDPSAMQRAAFSAVSQAQQEQSPFAKPISSVAARAPISYAAFARQPEPAGPQGPTPAPSAPPPAQVPQQPVTAQQAASQAPIQQQMQQPAIRRQLGMPSGYYQQPMQPQMPQQPSQSITQQASRGGAQSISNYLSALRQAGAGTNNAMMNAPGQQGAGPQAGFMGFGQNGIQTQLGGQFIGPQQMQTGLSFQNNMASAGPTYFAGNQAYSPGLMQAQGPQLANTGGISTVNGPGLLNGAGYGAPQWQTPQPWANPLDPGQSDAAWNSMSSDEKSAYLGVPRSGGFLEKTPPQSYDWPSQQGSFYNTSDERAKENIAPAENELEDFMQKLGIYSYEYKNKEHGEGRYVSPMAQDIEASEAGRKTGAVVTDPQTGLKKVDYGRLMGVNTAALALVNNKINKLEAQFKKALKNELKTKRGK